MCRLLGIASLHAVAPADVVAAQLELFRELSRLHDDGWGMAYLGDPGVDVATAGAVAASSEALMDSQACLGRYRTVRPAYADPHFAEVSAAHPSRASVLHLRWASSKMSNILANTHPFLADGIAFTHNGYLGTVEALEPFLPAGTVSATGTRAGITSEGSVRTGIVLGGRTDSERYFAIVRGFMRDGLGPAEAVEAAATLLRQHFPQASLNALVLTAEQLIVVHANELAKPSVDDMLAQGFTRDTLPAGHKDEYYKLYLHRSESEVVVASTGIDTLEWERLPEESVTIITLSSLEVRTQQIGARLPVESAA